MPRRFQRDPEQKRQYDLERRARQREFNDGTKHYVPVYQFKWPAPRVSE